MSSIYIRVKTRKLKAKIYQIRYFFCYQYAHLYTHVSSNLRRYILGVSFPYCMLWGRRESPEPIRCEECGWGGMVRWLVHTYQGDGTGEDVEPVDECPKCGGYL